MYHFSQIKRFYSIPYDPWNLKNLDWRRRIIILTIASLMRSALYYYCRDADKQTNFCLYSDRNKAKFIFHLIYKRTLLLQLWYLLYHFHVFQDSIKQESNNETSRYVIISLDQRTVIRSSLSLSTLDILLCWIPEVKTFFISINFLAKSMYSL